MTFIPSSVVEALAKRNYEAEMSAPWEGVSSTVRTGWLNEALEQVEIVLEIIEIGETE